jgi:Ni,Fe-hydrogenase maturation factor
MQRASVIGFGDVFRGDHCVGLCVIEALEQESLEDTVQLAYVPTLDIRVVTKTGWLEEKVDQFGIARDDGRFAG